MHAPAPARRPAASASRARTSRAAAPRAAAASPRDGSKLGRRDALVAGLLLAAPLAAPPPSLADNSRNKRYTVPISTLTTFQRAAMNDEFLKRCVKALDAGLDAADTPSAVRLLLADAASGGVDGSAIQFELGRPANKGLAPYAAKLKTIKAAIDGGAKPGQAPVSWADLTVLAARSTLRKSFLAAKVARAAERGVEPNYGAIAAMGSDFPVQIGRRDATAAGPDVQLPSAGADAGAVKAWFASIGRPPKGSSRALLFPRPALILWSAASPDPDATEAALAEADADFAEAVLKYTRSRSTASRTDFEVDTADAVARAASPYAGATIDGEAYLYPLEVEQVNIS